MWLLFSHNDIGLIDNAIDKAAQGRSSVPTGPMRHAIAFTMSVTFPISFRRPWSGYFPPPCEWCGRNRGKPNQDVSWEHVLAEPHAPDPQDTRDIWTRFSQRFSGCPCVFVHARIRHCALSRNVSWIYAVETGTQTVATRQKQKMFKTEQLKLLWSHFSNE